MSIIKQLIAVALCSELAATTDLFENQFAMQVREKSGYVVDNVAIFPILKQSEITSSDYDINIDNLGICLVTSQAQYTSECQEKFPNINWVVLWSMQSYLDFFLDWVLASDSEVANVKSLIILSSSELTVQLSDSTKRKYGLIAQGDSSIYSQLDQFAANTNTDDPPRFHSIVQKRVVCISDKTQYSKIMLYVCAAFEFIAAALWILFVFHSAKKLPNQSLRLQKTLTVLPLALAIFHLILAIVYEVCHSKEQLLMKQNIAYIPIFLGMAGAGIHTIFFALNQGWCITVEKLCQKQKIVVSVVALVALVLTALYGWVLESYSTTTERSVINGLILPFLASLLACNLFMAYQHVKKIQTNTIQMKLQDQEARGAQTIGDQTGDKVLDGSNLRRRFWKKIAFITSIFYTTLIVANIVELAIPTKLVDQLKTWAAMVVTQMLQVFNLLWICRPREDFSIIGPNEQI